VVLKGTDWLNDNCCNVSLAVSLLSDDVFESLDASILFSFVLMFKVSHGILDLGERCEWPVKCRQALQVDLSIAARQSGCGVAMVAVLEAKHCQLRGVLDVVVLGVLDDGHCEG
jgi:hypothetical protein